MKASNLLVPMAALAHMAHGQHTRDEQCETASKSVKRLADQFAPGLVSDRMAELIPGCGDAALITQGFKAELQHLHLVCYYQDKKEKLDKGGIVFFTPPQANHFYNPKQHYNLVADIAKTNKKNADQPILLKRLGNDYAAVSLTTASPETVKVFKDYFSKNPAASLAEDFLVKSQFLFVSGESEVPDFDRALYAMSLEGRYSSYLSQNPPNEPLLIPSEMLKVAFENDPKLTDSEIKFLTQSLDKKGTEINIGKGADEFGLIIRNVIASIEDKCPAKPGAANPEPLKGASLTGTSTFFPMRWNNSALKHFCSAEGSGRAQKEL